MWTLWNVFGWIPTDMMPWMKCFAFVFFKCEIFMRIVKFFQCLSYKGDSVIFFQGFVIVFVTWIHLGIPIYMCIAIRVFYIHIWVFHIGCAFRCPLRPSVFWHLEWLGPFLWSTFYFEWTRVMVWGLILWFSWLHHVLCTVKSYDPLHGWWNSKSLWNAEKRIFI